jgi:hypothetical protein
MKIYYNSLVDSSSASYTRSPVSEGFVGDPWLSIMLTICHILHSVSHWPVLVYFIISLLTHSPTASNSSATTFRHTPSLASEHYSLIHDSCHR